MTGARSHDRIGRRLALLGALLALPAAAARGDGSVVTLRFLGNEGFAIEARGQAVLIDALQVVGRADRAELPADVYDRMLRRRPPFETVPLVLASHSHGDHFDPATTLAFLKRHPETTLASSKAVLSAFRAAAPEAAALGDRLRELDVPGATLEVGRARVSGFALPHIAPQMYPEQVVAHVVEVGGKRILHLGDAELADDDLAALELRARRIDVAIVPYWAFTREGARERFARLIAARRVVAMRLPAVVSEEVRRKVRQAAPGAVILARPMASIRL